MARPTGKTTTGFGAVRRLYRGYVIGGGALASGGLLFAAFSSSGSGWFLPALALGVGGCCASLGVWGLRIGSASPVLSTSLNLVQSGKVVEASEQLETLSSNKAASVVAACHLQRAMIAVRAGNLDAIIEHTDAMIAAPTPLSFRTVREAQRCVAHGLRAWARAAKGDPGGAMADAQAVRASTVPTPEALAHAALAEAMLLERSGDRAGLARLLRTERRLLMGGLDIRERAVVRAMQRLLAAAPRSVYRTAAAPPRDDSTEQPTIAQWLDRVAPQLSTFALPASTTTANARELPAPKLVPSAAAVAKVTAQAKGPTGLSNPLIRLLALWGLLIAMLVAIFLFLDPASSKGAVDYAPSAPSEPISALWAVPVIGGLVGLFAWLVRKNQTVARRLNKLSTAILIGEDVDAELASIATSRQDLTAAQALLLRASVADRRGHLAQGIAFVDEGRARLCSLGSRAAAGGILAPALTATRAYLLAAMGRADEAAAELEAVPSDYLFLERTRFAVQLVAFLARGDVDGAGLLVQSSSLELSLGPRDELLRDLVRAATAPERAGAAEIGRLRTELRDDEESARWIEAVAPVLLARFDRATTSTDLDDEPSEGEVAANVDREALAEEELAAEADLAELRERRA